jgi:broad specificity phosphatase PhoE
VKDMSREIWIVRHGETEWSRTGKHTGRTDVPLTRRGKDEAAALRRPLADRRFALVLASPLSRAWETAELAGFRGMASASDDLLEWDYGAVEGRTSAEMQRQDPGWTIWTGNVPAGETIHQVAARTRRVLDRAADAGGDVLLFAHGHVLRILTATWLGLDPREGRRFALATASIGVLGEESGTHAILSWNPSLVRGAPATEVPAAAQER